MDTPLTDELIKDVNPKSRAADYWILKHQRAVDLARKLERDRARLMQMLEACVQCDLHYAARDCGLDYDGDVMDAARSLLSELEKK